MVKRQIAGIVLIVMLVLAWQSEKASATQPNRMPENPSLYSVDQVGGAVNTVEIEGNIAYVGIGPRVHLFNIENAAEPEFLGQSPILGDLIKKILVEGDFVYVIHNDGLEVLDASNLASPALLGSFPSQGEFNDLTKQGNYVFVTEGEIYTNGSYMYGGVRVIDVSDPAGMSEVDYYDPDQTMINIVLYQNYAYVTPDYDLEDVHILDITDPTNITQASTWEHNDSLQDVVIDGNHLYFAGGPRGADVVDVTNPLNPVDIGSMALGGVTTGIAVSDNKAYTFSWGWGVRVYDISDPTMPNEIGTYGSLDNSSIREIVVEASNVFLPDSRASLYVLDATIPGNIQEIHHFEPIVQKPLDVGTDGNVVLTLDAVHGLQILNHPNPDQVIGSYDIFSNYSALGVSGTTAAIDRSGIVTLVDFSNPAEPIERGSFGIIGSSARDIKIVGDYAYFALASGSSGLRIADISDLDNPTLVGSSGSFVANELVVGNDHAFVAASIGLHIIDVSDPTAPTEVGYIGTGSYVYGVDLVDDQLYVADDRDGLRVYDVSNPTLPIEIGFVSLPYVYESAVVYGDKAYLTGWLLDQSFRGLIVVDISDPTNMTELYTYDTAGTAENLVVFDDTVYVADSEGGLYFWQELSLEFNQFLPAILHN